MIKRLSAIGNSLGIIIERPILELLHIDRETPLEVSTDGEALIIRPSREEKKEQIKASAARMMNAHNDMLRKLSQ